MEKIEIHDQIKEKYAINESLEEADVKKEDKKLYKEAVKTYGSWEKTLKNTGIIKRNLREREKFVLYSIMRRRFELYGEEALRPKNVTPEELKERIVENFKTLKNLTTIVKNWDEDRIMYEIRKAFLTGSTIQDIEKENAELYEQMLYHFKNLEHAQEEYYKRFGDMSKFIIGNVQTLQAEEEEEREAETEVEEKYEKIPKYANKRAKVKVLAGDESETAEALEIENEKSNTDMDYLLEFFINMGLLKGKEDVTYIKKAMKKSKEETLAFLFKIITESGKTKKKITDEMIYEQNPVFYYAIKGQYKSFENAFNEIKKQFLSI